MWDAINKRTGERIYAGDAWTPDLYADPHNELWVAPKENIVNWDILNVNEIPLELVEGHIRKDYLVRSFFRIKNCKNAITISESEEHKRKKTLISLLLTYNAPIFLVYDSERYPLNILPIDRERIRKNERLIEVTRSITDECYKRTDVMIPFHYSNYWGNGLAIEIRVSEKDEHKEEKEKFWFTRGYSLIWADKDDFIEDGYGIKSNELKVIPNSIGLFLLKDNIEKNVNDKYQKINVTYEFLKGYHKTFDNEFNKYNKFLICKQNHLLEIIIEYEDKINDALEKIEKENNHKDNEIGTESSTWM